MQTTMEQEVYQRPELEVIELSLESNLLVEGSGTVDPFNPEE